MKKQTNVNVSSRGRADMPAAIGLIAANQRRHRMNRALGDLTGWLFEKHGPRRAGRVVRRDLLAAAQAPDITAPLDRCPH